MSNAIHPALPHLTFLVGVTIAVVISVTKCVECFVQSRRKLDQVKDDDALLADSNLRALRRALLIADIQNHPSRLLKSINDNSERERIRNTGLRGDGLTSIFSEPGTIHHGSSLNLNQQADNNSAADNNDSDESEVQALWAIRSNKQTVSVVVKER